VEGEKAITHWAQLPGGAACAPLKGPQVGSFV